MGGFEKGSSLKSSFTAIRAELGESDWQRVLEVLNPEDREIVMAPDRHGLVPTAVTGRHQAFKRAGGMISSIYSGVTAESIPHPNGRGRVLKLVGLDDEPFASCVIGGWIERAIERFGAHNASVVEREWAAGHNAAQTLVFDLSWESPAGKKQARYRLGT